MNEHWSSNEQTRRWFFAQIHDEIATRGQRGLVTYDRIKAGALGVAHLAEFAESPEGAMAVIREYLDGEAKRLGVVTLW